MEPQLQPLLCQIHLLLKFSVLLASMRMLISPFHELSFSNGLAVFLMPLLVPSSLNSEQHSHQNLLIFLNGFLQC
uniref:Uncharacterized protein n=1 Tax=Arundo donax TaxID=35708 RepID=A0A0A9CBM0_ARUDO